MFDTKLAYDLLDQLMNSDKPIDETDALNVLCQSFGITSIKAKVILEQVIVILESFRKMKKEKEALKGEIERLKLELELEKLKVANLTLKSGK